MADPNEARNSRDKVPPPEERTLEEREKRTLPLRRVYMIVLVAIVLVLAVALIF